jgi:hypothetical protein
VDRFDDERLRDGASMGIGPARGVRVVLGWESLFDPLSERSAACDVLRRPVDPWGLRRPTNPPGISIRRQVRSTALAPSASRLPATLLDDEFDAQRLVTHPVTILDLARNGIHLVVRVRPERDRDNWIGIEEGRAFSWSKVVLRSLSEPSIGTYLVRYSFAGACPYELIRRALLGRPTGLGREDGPLRA